MKSFASSLADHLADGATTLSWCWRITRADGEVLGFTDHDRALTFDGTTFEPESGLVAADLLGLQADVQIRGNDSARVTLRNETGASQTIPACTVTVTARRAASRERAES